MTPSRDSKVEELVQYWTKRYGHLGRGLAAEDMDTLVRCVAKAALELAAEAAEASWAKHRETCNDDCCPECWGFHAAIGGVRSLASPPNSRPPQEEP